MRLSVSLAAASTIHSRGFWHGFDVAAQLTTLIAVFNTTFHLTRKQTVVVDDVSVLTEGIEILLRLRFTV